MEWYKWINKTEFTKEEIEMIESLSKSTELRLTNRNYSSKTAGQYAAIFHLTEFGPPFPAKELIRLAKIGWETENCTG